jgi:hypothetical protein
VIGSLLQPVASSCRVFLAPWMVRRRISPPARSLRWHSGADVPHPPVTDVGPCVAAPQRSSNRNLVSLQHLSPAISQRQAPRVISRATTSYRAFSGGLQCVCVYVCVCVDTPRGRHPLCSAIFATKIAMQPSSSVCPSSFVRMFFRRLLLLLLLARLSISHFSPSSTNRTEALSSWGRNCCRGRDRGERSTNVHAGDRLEDVTLLSRALSADPSTLSRDLLRSGELSTCGTQRICRTAFVIGRVNTS